MLPHLFAYLDLASGSMIVQAAIAGIVAAPILFRNQIRRILHRGEAIEQVPVEHLDASASTEGTVAGARAESSDASRP